MNERQAPYRGPAAAGRSPEAWRAGLGRFVNVIPHTRELGLEVEEVAPPRVRMRLPWRDALLGDAERGLVHGGVLSMLLDTVCGSAVLCGLPAPEVCPTLDLRVDHYRPAVAGMPIWAEARVLRVTRAMVFTEGTLWQVPDRPIARGIGNFVRLGERNTPEGFAEALFGEADHA
ncbi:PaaI family thioesterase [Halomonas sp. MCCC 1A17488]|uniref:PaaI family thioesterase n=1 Tax=Billgrantia sulfidoxydans TaxID=2733484 RepID=A0ABX7W7U4_9GAMM|nr:MULTISPECIES: PaaI family thioesterase [Halomonas]MCE8018258.1 PaaI family thioesterase [Halomonas sp. MCCC 1A17488]MCG3241591.1 PaaI family thioesterase [Halomonas sp. MCCC 1A17488]QPP48461.1 PaaI family thioesterase [Halomonas sp. SS10-MC5]QTP55772.1 PaaI family thioesterase [Halomonas sulfidoxydans]